VDVPAQDHLGDGFLVLDGDRGDGLVCEWFAVVSERAVGFDRDPVLWQALRGASLLKYGWISNWLTAGTIPVSSMIRSRWTGWKFETPALRSRPSSRNRATVRHVDT
jgi:hypothetical protein